MSVARGASALGRSTPSRSLRLSVAGLGTALLVVLAAGCTSTAEPSPLPEPTVSASASPSATPTPPTLPAEAEGTSPAAAKAFARHYFDLINYAARTGDTKELRKYGAPGCVSCEAIAHNIEKIYTGGGHVAREDWELRTIAVLKSASGRAVVSLGTIIHREVIVRANGDREVKAGGRQPMTMFLRNGPAGAPQVTKLDLVT